MANPNETMDTTPAAAEGSDPQSTASVSGSLKIKDATIEAHTKSGFGEIIDLMKATNAFPSGPTRVLYTAHPAFNNIVSHTSERILAVMSKILKHQQIKGNIQRRDNDEKFELLLECNDFMLERINSTLDDMAGIRKMPGTVLVPAEIAAPPGGDRAVSGSWNHNHLEQRKLATAAKMHTNSLLTARNIARPQLHFRTPIDNSNATAFEPRLRDKPNAIRPLAILPEYGDDGDIESYLHPYECELTKFEPPAKLLEPSGGPQQPLELAATPLVYIDEVAQLGPLLDDLRASSEVAVDLEHHSYRTFQGITCLMQISTRRCDYIVDTLALRDELHVLNEVFTDPRVVKVLHGADSDVEWLQRDLSLYLVNVFDTHQAAKRLNLARLSLAFLLKQYCRLDVDKTFQLADWRVRPLPAELTLYARQDTHYLLYVYDVMRDALLAEANGQTNLLRAVYQAGREICLKKYVKPRCRPDSHMEMYGRSKRTFDNRQLHALREIYAWRDAIARQEDESCGYVLPNHMMLHMAEVLPREMQGILACCNPIPPLVRQHLHALHQMVLRARDQPLVRPVPRRGADGGMEKGAGDGGNRGNAFGAGALQGRDLWGPLYCPHDMTQVPEFRDDLPTLLGGGADGVAASDRTTVEKPPARSLCSVFDSPANSSGDDETGGDVADRRSRLQRVRQLHFVSPYARYLAILPVAEKQRLAEQAAIDEQNSKKKLCPDKLRTQDDKLAAVELISSALRASTAAADVAVPESPVVEAEPALDRLYLKRHRDQQPRKSTGGEDDAPETPKRSKFVIDVNAASPGSDGTPAAGVNTTTPRAVASGSGRKQKKGKPMSNKKSAQSSNMPVTSTPPAFDYAQVDFNKFRGGSLAKVNTNETSSKFRGKGKGRRGGGGAGGNDKKFNKLLTFNKSGGGVSMKRK